MAPTPLIRLVAQQKQRHDEITRISARMRERDQNALNKTIVQARLDKINEIWGEACKTHIDITVRADAANTDYITENKYEALQDVYDDVSDFLLNSLENFSNDGDRNPRRRRREADDDEDELPAKLPRLDLPTFSGEYEDWDSFADMFSALVHNVGRISNARKLHYLKSCLEGPAADLVKNVPALAINYESTWKALKHRFYNPRLTINRHLDALSNLPYLPEESATKLRAFVDEAQRIVRALTNLKVPVEQWDLWLVHTVEVRLDEESRKSWESDLITSDRQVALLMPDDDDTPPRFPKFADLMAFLERRAQSLSVVHAEKSDKKSSRSSKNNANLRKAHHAQSSQPAKRGKCSFCGEDHYSMYCPAFVEKKPSDRKIAVQTAKLCFNCLGRHLSSDCQSRNTCKKCQGDHHTLLHHAFIEEQSNPSPSRRQRKQKKRKLPPKNEVKACVARPAGGTGPSVNACNPSVTSNNNILLATAQVTVIGPNGKQTRARALLDQGSEASFVSESLVQLLGLPRDRIMSKLTGIGGVEAGELRHATCFTMQSRVDAEFKVEVNAFVLPKLTTQLPSRSHFDLDMSHFRKLSLADPEFNISDRVDILLGADVYGQLLQSGLTKFPSTLLVAQNTALGWVVSGPTKGNISRRAVRSNRASVKALRCAVSDDLSDILQRFWTIEEVPNTTKILKPDDEACEKLFAETYTRTSEGRFQVRLPIKSEPPRVADETKRMAFGSLKHQLQRLSRDPTLFSAYSDFMDTYIQLGHMVPVPIYELNNPNSWYLPHHAVVQKTAENLKLRVVFDASRRTREKQCLNDFLMPGPPLQNDLSLTLLNWRRYLFVFTADIVKMFRQIRVARDDQDFQRIIWTPVAGKAPVHYRLTTVTYGTSCAPYLAIRTLLQLAQDERERFPLGAACLESNTYVDDTFAGADELATAIRKRDELIGILKSAGIELDKWAANHPSLLPSHTQNNGNGSIKQIECDKTVTTLGVNFDPASDNFNFSAPNLSTTKGKFTKRTISSDIARLFDPLGWLAPVTVTGKIIMQDLWIEKIDWDEPLSTEVRERWEGYCKSLLTLASVSVNRWLGLTHNKSFEIHGFSDASSRAYAAVVYIRIAEGNGKQRVSLLTAKTKVSPVKTVSIPNLELLGATLLVKLVLHVQKLEFLQNVPIHLWSDSQIVLTWLKKHPCNWKVFVANRVSLIQTELPSARWSHVPTKQNPADLATRGATPEELRSNDLWWHGPIWLTSSPSEWPQPPRSLRALRAHAKKARVISDEPKLLAKYSTLTRLIRITAWCLRPILQLRRKNAGQSSYPKYLTTADLDNARSTVVKLAQAHAFSGEIETLRQGKVLPKRHSLQKLQPFLDGDGILKVKGRLSNAKVPHSVMHPPILPRESALSRLFILHAHHKALHGGPTLTTSILLRFAWILGMRPLVKTAIRKCVKCQRQKPRLAYQLMGDLPAERVIPARPFTTTGLDYAGPFKMRASKGRGQSSYKGYIALFVCFATKAIHLEVVSDLTTATFIAAFRRFVSRRGLCKQLYSDNATNFRGADAELRAMFKNASDFYKESKSLLANDGTDWTFIPPTTPHYGGLWEAGVKSTKNLLKKIIGERKLTFEEMSTVLAEIEACLNSRPLGPLKPEQPEDLQALTPSHFLIGTATGIIPDEASPAVPENRLDRFQLLQRLREEFWKRWLNEYVLLLQERSKWRNPTTNFSVGQLVLMKDDQCPPSKWPLGRVLTVHPGPDGHVRVVTVKTATNTLRRHVARLAPLNLDTPKDKEDSAKRKE